MGNYSSVIREIRHGPSRYYKVSNMFCRQCMVKLHHVGYHNTKTSKGNLPVNKIDKDVMNQMVTSTDLYLGRSFGIASNGNDILNSQQV